jgi:hypothetical protein
MTENQMFLGITTTLTVVGAYFVGLFQGQRQPVRWREFFDSVVARVTRRGFAWSAMLPVAWVLLFYAFVAHTRLSLGRWPHFGEALTGGLWFHEVAVECLIVALAGSLFVVPVILVGCLFLPRWRHFSVYTTSYAAAVGLSIGALFMAPDPFLNWFFD